MRLSKVRVKNYRSIIDTGEFEVESLKTILVGPNEAGKTAILQAIQQINPPVGTKKFNPLRDYPRAQYTKISRGDLDPSEVDVVTAVFELEDIDLEHAPEQIKGFPLRYTFTRYLNNNSSHCLLGFDSPTYNDVKNDLIRLTAHLDRSSAQGEPKPHSESLSKIIHNWAQDKTLSSDAEILKKWLEEKLPFVDEEDKTEVERWEKIDTKLRLSVDISNFLKYLDQNKPVFVLYSNYFRVKPIIHLGNLAKRLESNSLDDDAYDYGNSCLLRLLGFTAKELSELGKVTDPSHTSIDLESFRERLDQRSYELNAASVELTQQIIRVWNPDDNKAEASRLKLTADGQYLKVVVEDNIGVEVELDQRSEGFQWLVSFFIVFFAEAKGKHKNTVLLLDEPGVSLHALKQREFRKTISLLADENQTLYSTHSPFLVGPDELDIVRVVELTDRAIGTKVHTTVSSSDPAALLPLQEALGYDLAQSLFANQRNLILEGLTDYWYIEAISGLLKDGGKTSLHEKIALVPANTASKVVYFATILTSHNLKVAALLDSDNAGDQAANQEILVHRLSNKRILRTSDFTVPKIEKAEIEDLLRETLVDIAKSELNWDITMAIANTMDKPIIDLFQREIGKDFSKYRLAKAFLRWSREHSATDLSVSEIQGCTNLINAINVALK
ncbi:UNVERIFIED_ORG: AAA15 family ATPase/GTPase [Kosakonia oryzae]|uniref:AAA ATPase domain-containing protein n=1 Tax=Kosakonia radicincitans TaxID=283686 RepID=A0AAX2EPF0_9ENTR|nr:AAA family ATPase [Kosakonia radicincitans]MDP9566866.1 AAA15 family ATPase/GTPase [Kosakonia oryzae]SFE79112.1 AAA ATPase domain-containing protein [Kosakonia radicincitans]SFR04646.1 AAA ATPase domain-containing protein [Kosakonia radicincitans]SFT55332.1 AAA ATPase domain-containing protein [Kosakonia radicincitans]SFX36095.1 AAA ATPase domain-containing protein [Kosakonia radicincitans]